MNTEGLTDYVNKLTFVIRLATSDTETWYTSAPWFCRFLIHPMTCAESCLIIHRSRALCLPVSHAWLCYCTFGKAKHLPMKWFYSHHKAEHCACLRRMSGCMITFQPGLASGHLRLTHKVQLSAAAHVPRRAAGGGRRAGALQHRRLPHRAHSGCGGPAAV